VVQRVIAKLSLALLACKAALYKFDIKTSHTQVRLDGALSIPTIEAKIDMWIAKKKG
jgi:uncharacterized protein (DUF885 family)